MRIYVKDSRGKLASIETEENEYIKDLKKKIITKMRINKDDIALTFNGFDLEDNNKVSYEDYDITDSCTIIYLGAFTAGVLYELFNT